MIKIEDKKKVEAVLFTVGKFITLEEIAKACNMGSVGYIKQMIEELKKDYETRETSLQILQEENKYKLNIKKEYGHLTNKLVSDAEFDAPTTKTLAIIAYKQPMFQAEVIKIRGNKAYDHIKFLKEAQLITAEKSGRTRLLKLAPKFYDYFDVMENELKSKIQDIKPPEEPQVENNQESEKLPVENKSEPTETTKDPEENNTTQL